MPTETVRKTRHVTGPRNSVTTAPTTERDGRSLVELLKEPSTWAGLFTVAAAVVSGGGSMLTDPSLVLNAIAGLGLVLAKEG